MQTRRAAYPTATSTRYIDFLVHPLSNFLRGGSLKK